MAYDTSKFANMSTAANGAALSMEQIKKAMSDLQASPLFAEVSLRRRRSASDLGDLFNPLVRGPSIKSMFGVPVLVNRFLPPEGAKIQVRQLYLKDGTPLLREKFIATENRWWLEQFGTQPVMYFLGTDDALMMHPRVQEMVERMKDRLEGDILKSMTGGK